MHEKSGGQTTLIDPALEKVGGQLTPLTPCFRGLWRQMIGRQHNRTRTIYVCLVSSSTVALC